MNLSQLFKKLTAHALIISFTALSIQPSIANPDRISDGELFVGSMRQAISILSSAEDPECLLTTAYLTHLIQEKRQKGSHTAPKSVGNQGDEWFDTPLAEISRELTGLWKQTVVGEYSPYLLEQRVKVWQERLPGFKDELEGTLGVINQTLRHNDMLTKTSLLYDTVRLLSTTLYGHDNASEFVDCLSFYSDKASLQVQKTNLELASSLLHITQFVQNDAVAQASIRVLERLQQALIVVNAQASEAREAEEFVRMASKELPFLHHLTRAQLASELPFYGVSNSRFPKAKRISKKSKEHRKHFRELPFYGVSDFSDEFPKSKDKYKSKAHHKHSPVLVTNYTKLGVAAALMLIANQVVPAAAAPSVVNNHWEVQRGERFIVDSNNFRVTDPTVPDESLMITVWDRSYCQFNRDWFVVSIGTFDQQEISDGRIDFMHQASSSEPPTVIFKVSNGNATEDITVPATIIYDPTPWIPPSTGTSGEGLGIGPGTSSTTGGNGVGAGDSESLGTGAKVGIFSGIAACLTATIGFVGKKIYRHNVDKSNAKRSPLTAAFCKIAGVENDEELRSVIEGQIVPGLDSSYDQNLGTNPVVRKLVAGKLALAIDELVADNKIDKVATGWFSRYIKGAAPHKIAMDYFSSQDHVQATIDQVANAAKLQKSEDPKVQVTVRSKGIDGDSEYLTNGDVVIDVAPSSPQNATPETPFELSSHKIRRLPLAGDLYELMPEIYRDEEQEVSALGISVPQFPSGRETVELSLGSGNFGEIILAWNKRTHETVACKRVRGAKAIAASVAEANIQKAIAGRALVPGSNVLPIYNTINGSDELLHFMPLAGYGNGATVQRYIQETDNGSLTSQVLARCFRDLLRGVDAIHNKKYAHLDLKPENMVFRQDEEGTVTGIITDFGCSKKLDEIGQKANGDMRYLSPERFAALRGERTSFSGQKADAWASGLFMLCLITGETPDRLLKMPMDRGISIQECTDEFFDNALRDVFARQWPGSLKPQIEEVKKLLVVNPNERSSVGQVLNSAHFKRMAGTLDAPLGKTSLTRLRDEAAKPLAARSNASQSGASTNPYVGGDQSQYYVNHYHYHNDGRANDSTGGASEHYNTSNDYNSLGASIGYQNKVMPVAPPSQIGMTARPPVPGRPPVLPQRFNDPGGAYFTE